MKVSKIPDCKTQLEGESDVDYELRMESLGYVKVLCHFCGSVFWDIKDGDKTFCEDCRGEE